MWQFRAYTNGKGGQEQREREHPAPQTTRPPSSAREAAERHPRSVPQRRGREAAQGVSGAKKRRHRRGGRATPAPKSAAERSRGTTKISEGGEPRGSKRRGTGQARRWETRAQSDCPPLPCYLDEDSYSSLRHRFNVSASHTTIRAALWYDSMAPKIAYLNRVSASLK